MKFFDRVRASTATTGQGTIALGSAAEGDMLSFAEAGALDGDQVTYILTEGQDFEIGRGTIGGGVTTMTRDAVILSKISGSVSTGKMELTGSAVVTNVYGAVDANSALSLAGKQAKMNETVKTAGWTATVADAGGMAAYNSASAGTVTLPPVAASSGEVYFFRSINTGTLTIDPNGAEQIEGAATLAVTRGRSAMIWPNEGKTAWRAIVFHALPALTRPGGAFFCDYGGTANAITLAHGGAGALQVGTAVRFRASAANTGATTINLDGLGAIACRTITGAALPAGYIRTGIETVATYDGTFWVVDRQIENGSNANGKYTKYADGGMVCASTVNMDTTDVNTTTVRMQVAWTFPSAFSAVPDSYTGNLPLPSSGNFVSIAGGSSGRASVRAAGASASASAMSFTAWFEAASITIGSSQISNVTLRAEGRWY